MDWKHFASLNTFYIKNKIYFKETAVKIKQSRTQVFPTTASEIIIKLVPYCFQFFAYSV